MAPLVLVLAIAAALAYWTGRPEYPPEHAGEARRLPSPAAAAKPAAAATVPLRPPETGAVGGSGGSSAQEEWSTAGSGPPAAEAAPEPEPKRPRYTYIKGYGWLEQAAGFERGLRDAVKEERILTLYVYTDWCPYCRRLERNVLADTAVQECLAYSVKVKVNPERGAAEKRIADTVGVRSYPSLYFVDPESGAMEKVPNRYEDSSTLLAACRETVG